MTTPSSMVERAAIPALIEKRLRIRQRDCECQALDFRDIGGRNADDKAVQYEAAASDFREAADAIVDENTGEEWTEDAFTHGCLSSTAPAPERNDG